MNRGDCLPNLTISVSISDMLVMIAPVRSSVHQPLVDSRWHAVVPIDTPSVELDFQD
jgi:hypothetical protein